jgi:hypothetical protein
MEIENGINAPNVITSPMPIRNSAGDFSTRPARALVVDYLREQSSTPQRRNLMSDSDDFHVLPRPAPAPRPEPGQDKK